MDNQIPAQAAQPAPSEPKRWKKIVLIAVISSLITGVGFFAYLSFLAPKTPADVARVFLSNLLNERFEKIEKEMASELNAEAFLEFLRSVRSSDLKNIEKAKEVAVLDETIIGDAASVAMLITSQDDEQYAIAVYLKMDEGRWKLYDIGI